MPATRQQHLDGGTQRRRCPLPSTGNRHPASSSISSINRYQQTLSNINLRPATPDDYEFAYRVHRAAMREAVEQTYGWDEAWQARYFREHFDPAKRQIIRCDGVDVGVLSVEEREDSLFLALVAILPEYQGRGIGTTLIRRLQRRAKAGSVPVTLQVLKINRARALYERLGFVLTGETETHYQMRWSDDDASLDGQFPRLETERLILRHITSQDAKAIFRLFSNQKVARYLDFPALKTMGEARNVVDWCDEIWREGTGMRWGITRQGNETLIGTCGFHNWAPHDSRADIGYDLLPEYWGQGLMREAVSRMIRYGIDELSLHRLQAMVHPENVRSRGLLERLGFTQEGTLREWRAYRGQFWDEICYSLLEQEWEAPH